MCYDVCKGGINVNIGERLKKFRIVRKMSQKQLAVMSSMSEPAIRNYELGNRYPNEKKLDKIANAMKINPLALADPDFTTYDGLMHALFQLEDMYNLKPKEIDGQIILSFDVKPTSTIKHNLQLWHNELEDLKNENISNDDYDNWRYSFPRLQAIRETKARRELREKKKRQE